MSRPFLTKVMSPWDYRTADLSAFCIPFEADREQIEEGMLSLRKKYAYLIPVDTVELGDIVTLCCRSEKAKYNKDSVKLNVGKNLYSREIETQLVGMAVGSEKELTADGVQVNVKLLKAERTQLPELNDEFLAANLQTVHTMQELEEWYINAQLEEHLTQQAAMAADYLQECALRSSQIDVNEDERQEARAGGEKVLRDMWVLNGLPLDEIADEQAQEILGYPSAQDYIDWFSDLSEKDVSYAALGYDLLLKEGKEPTEGSYREALRKMTEEEYIPPEQLSYYTYSAYARQVCAEYYHDLLESYAYDILKEKIL